MSGTSRKVPVKQMKKWPAPFTTGRNDFPVSARICMIGFKRLVSCVRIQREFTAQKKKIVDLNSRRILEIKYETDDTVKSRFVITKI